MSHLRPMIYLACSRLKNSGAVVQYKEMPKNARGAGERQGSGAQVERSLPFFPPPPPPFPYRARLIFALLILNMSPLYTSWEPGTGCYLVFNCIVSLSCNNLNDLFTICWSVDDFCCEAQVLKSHRHSAFVKHKSYMYAQLHGYLLKKLEFSVVHQFCF